VEELIMELTTNEVIKHPEGWTCSHVPGAVIRNREVAERSKRFGIVLYMDTETVNGIKFQILRTPDGRYSVYVDGIKRATKSTLKGANGVINKIVRG
jgi:hypothetical protein